MEAPQNVDMSVGNNAKKMRRTPTKSGTPKMRIITKEFGPKANPTLSDKK